MHCRQRSARGSIRFDGQAVNAAEVSIEQMVAAGMTLVPERRELFGEMSVADNLLLGAFQRCRSGQRDQRRTIEEVFTLFPRLRDRRTQLAGTLSGGERQMLAVGRALMAKPKLLMLDEPSLGLAPLIVREIFHIIVELKRRGVSILLVEQNARAALQTADYAYVLETGGSRLKARRVNSQTISALWRAILGSVVGSLHRRGLRVGAKHAGLSLQGADWSRVAASYQCRRGGPHDTRLHTIPWTVRSIARTTRRSTNSEVR